MSRRALAATAIMLLLATVASPVHAQSPFAPSSKFDLGYSPGLLFPSSGGTPVFSAGDSLWVRSNYNSTVEVQVSPVGPNATAYTKSVPPGVPVDVLMFNSSSREGFWELGLVGGGGFQPVVAFLVSNAASVPAGLTLSGEKFVAGSLAMNFTTSPSLALYGGQACVLGNENASGVAIPVPAQLGGGSLTLTRDGDTVSVTPQGLGRANFSLSLELYYSYSFLAPNSTTILVTRSVVVATAPGVLVSSAPGFVSPGGISFPSLTLREDAPLKPGRYQLRAFFESSSGLSFVAADVLIPGGASWVWLGRCTDFPVYSNNFGILFPIGTDPNLWPRSVWLMFSSYGEQGVAQVPLNLELATVGFEGSPWGVKLSDYGLDLNPLGGVSQIAAYNGTAYLILSAQEGSFGYKAGLGGRVFFTGTVGPVLPFTSASVSLNVSEISVSYLVAGRPYEGGSVTLSDSAGVVASRATDAAGRAVFYTIPGTYTLEARGGNSSASEVVTLLAGQDLGVTFGGPGTGQLDLLVEAGLVAVAVVGVAGNLVVFARGRSERSGSR